MIKTAEHIEPLAGDDADTRRADHLRAMAAGAMIAEGPPPLKLYTPPAARSSVRVYIAGPISKGDLARNLNQATAAFVRLAKAGIAPLCPHWSAYSKPCYPIGDAMPGAVLAVGTIQGNGEMSHADWLAVDLPWVEVADAVLRLPGESAGADREVAHARERGIPVFDSIDDLIAWA